MNISTTMMLTIRINGQEIQLSLEDAKALYAQLKNIMVEKEYVTVPYYPTHPIPLITWSTGTAADSSLSAIKH